MESKVRSTQQESRLIGGEQNTHGRAVRNELPKAAPALVSLLCNVVFLPSGVLSPPTMLQADLPPLSPPPPPLPSPLSLSIWLSFPLPLPLTLTFSST